MRSSNHAGPYRTSRYYKYILLCLFFMGAGGCSTLFDVGAPTDVLTDDAVDNAQGAISLATGALDALTRVVGSEARGDGGIGGGNYIFVTGLLTDEFQIFTPLTSWEDLDSRTFLEGSTVVREVYATLQQARVQAQQAIELLTRYSSTTPQSLRARMYIIQGYTEVLLAELYCSGIPLSTAPYGKDIIYRQGLTTEQVLTTAIVHFDSALAIAPDSAPILTAAHVGKGRAFLGLGQYQEAMHAVNGILTSDRYNLLYSTQLPSTTNQLNRTALGLKYSVPNAKGGTSISWAAASDPRVPITVTAGVNVLTKYLDGNASIPLASGIEARLIEAEAQLALRQTSWLTTLNELRTDGTFIVTPRPGAPAGIFDTTWNAGSGGVPGLAPLPNPDTEDGALELIFRERGFWLFATGHRLGDLRRLVRHYGRDPNVIYPHGSYRTGDGSVGTIAGFYGDTFVVPVPDTELRNPLYQGCLNEEA